MPEYAYIARNAAGEEITGTVSADHESVVLRALDEQALYPIDVAEQTASRQARVKTGGRVRRKDVGVMYGQLADLLHAGVPMLRALDILARAGTRGRLSGVILELRDGVASGKTLTEAMKDHPAVFTPLHVAMVHAGEHASFLEEVLTDLSNFVERQDDLRNQVRGAMIYPAVLVTVGILVTTVMLVFVVPKFEGFFTRIAIPFPTRVLFAVSRALRTHQLVILCVLVLAVLGIIAFLRSATGRRIWEKLKLKIPVLGPTMRVVSVTRFCRILGTMLANGVPILQALGIARDATGSDVLGRNVDDAAEAVRKGQPLAEPLRAGKLFPAEIIEMIAVAEESNQLDRVLVQIAETVERRMNRRIDMVVRLVEPIILVIMAAIIGFVAVGLLYPIFSMAQQIQ